jgi:dTDP-4-amino-4,6-dideoxygalactose transaminase
MTFAASANVVVLCGATPVMCEVDLNSRNLTAEYLTKVLTKKTKVIMPVHFAGLPVDMDSIYAFATKHNLRVLEDAAHAIGSSYQGKKIGSFGDVISFSFHPNKNMTTIEGGALVLKNKAEADKLDLLRFHGITKDANGGMDVIIPSGKFNLPDVNAAVGLGQLKKLDSFCDKRRELVGLYFELLKHQEFISLPERGDNGHSWHIFAPLINFVALSTTRGEFIKKMSDLKIGIGVHYPALHLFTAYQKMGYQAGNFPNAEKIGEQIVTLPLFPLMNKEDVIRVCDSIKKVLY